MRCAESQESPNPTQTVDSIVVGFLGYLAAFYGLLEFLDRYQAARRLPPWLGFNDVQLSTLASWLAVFFKLLGFLADPCKDASPGYNRKMGR